MLVRRSRRFTSDEVANIANVVGAHGCCEGVRNEHVVYLVTPAGEIEPFAVAGTPA